MYAHPLEPRIARLEGSFEQIDERLGASERSTSARFDHVDRRFDHVDRRFDQVDHRFEQMDNRFAQMDHRFAQMDHRFDQVDRRFTWLVGLVVGTWGTSILGIIFHH